MSPIKEKHLAILAKHMLNHFECVSNGNTFVIRVPNCTVNCICEILGFERNIDDSFSKYKRDYAKKLYQDDLMPYLKDKMALALNLED